MRTTRVRRSIPSPRSTAPACPPTPCACGAGGADDGRRRSPRCPPPPGSSACRGGRPTPRAGRRGPPRPRPARGGPARPAGGRAPVRRGSLGQPPSASRGGWSGASLGRRTWRRWTKASGSASRGAALGPACSPAATSTTPGRPRSREPGGKSSRDGRPSRSAGSTASARRRPSRSIPTAIGTARPPTTPASRTFPCLASGVRYPSGSSSRRPASAAGLPSGRSPAAEAAEARPRGSPVAAFTLRVGTPLSGASVTTVHPPAANEVRLRGVAFNPGSGEDRPRPEALCPATSSASGSVRKVPRFGPRAGGRGGPAVSDLADPGREPRRDRRPPPRRRGPPRPVPRTAPRLSAAAEEALEDDPDGPCGIVHAAREVPGAEVTDAPGAAEGGRTGTRLGRRSGHDGRAPTTRVGEPGPRDRDGRFSTGPFGRHRRSGRAPAASPPGTGARRPAGGAGPGALGRSDRAGAGGCRGRANSRPCAAAPARRGPRDDLARAGRDRGDAGRVVRPGSPPRQPSAEGSPALVRAAEGNGRAERFIRTPKENLLRGAEPRHRRGAAPGAARLPRGQRRDLADRAARLPAGRRDRAEAALTRGSGRVGPKPVPANRARCSPHHGRGGQILGSIDVSRSDPRYRRRCRSRRRAGAASRHGTAGRRDDHLGGAGRPSGRTFRAEGAPA